MRTYGSGVSGTWQLSLLRSVSLKLQHTDVPIFLSQETQRGREQQTTPARNESKRCCSDNSRHVTILPRRRKQYQVIQTHGCSPSARRVSKGKMTTMKRKRPGTTQPASNQPPDLQQLAIDPAQFSRRIREKNLPRCSTTWRTLTLRSLRLFLSRLSGVLPKDSGLPVHSGSGWKHRWEKQWPSEASLHASSFGAFSLRSLRPLRFGTRVFQRTHVLKFDTHLWAVVPHCCETPTLPRSFLRASALCVFRVFCINGVRFSLSGASISRSWWVRFLVSCPRTCVVGVDPKHPEGLPSLCLLNLTTILHILGRERHRAAESAAAHDSSLSEWKPAFSRDQRSHHVPDPEVPHS